MMQRRNREKGEKSKDENGKPVAIIENMVS